MWRKPSVRSAAHQEVFLQRYSWLLLQAQRLTGHDRELSEDLVQEAFVHFVLRAPDLEAIEHLDAYLYVMIRNLHLSHLRRAGRQRACSLSAFDPDGMPDLPLAPNVQVDLAASEDLWRVCEWACRRKESAKSGSVLLFRFVHGYDPREIALLMRSPVRAVDDCLRLARREAALELREAAAPVSRSFQAMPPHGDMIQALRARVFAARQTPCLERAALCRLYQDPEGGSVSSGVLAHLVSCASCLEAVTELLELRPVSHRDPRDMLGPHDRGPRGSGGVSPGPGHDLRSRLRRRLQGVIGHRPSELRVAVNGFVVGAQRVTSELSEQSIAVNIAEPIAFVEVFGDDDVRLLYCDVTTPPAGEATQSARVSLSDGRSLLVALDFAGPWPTLQVTYLDPEFASESEAAPAPVVLKAPAPASGPDGRWAWAFGVLFARRTLWRAATAAGCLVLIAAAVGMFTSRRLTAAELLRESRIAEDRYLGQPGVLTHRILYLEELDPATRRSLARDRIEVWREGAQGPQARRYYPGGKRLVAGEWIERGGARSVYAAGVAVSRDAGLAPVDALTGGQPWRLDLSAGALASMVRPEAGTVTAASDRLVVIFERAGVAGAAGIDEIRLSFDDRSRRLIEASFLVRDNGRLRLFSLAEYSAKQLPIANVSASVFNPDPELLPAVSPAPAVPRRVLSAAELLRLEVDVHWRLDRAGATMGEQVAVSMAPDGLRVEGVVDTPARRAELLAALGPLAANPALRVDLRTAGDALAPSDGSSTPVAVRDFAVTSARVPAYSELRNFLGSQPDAPPESVSDARVEELATRLLERARRTLLHARAVERFQARVSATSALSLDTPRRERWRIMIARHLAAAATESAGLDDEFRAIFADLLPATSPAPETIDGDFAYGLRRLNDLATRQDRLLRELLTVSDRPVRSVPDTVREVGEALGGTRGLLNQLRARAERF